MRHATKTHTFSCHSRAPTSFSRRFGIGEPGSSLNPPGTKYDTLGHVVLMPHDEGENHLSSAAKHIDKQTKFMRKMLGENIDKDIKHFQQHRMVNYAIYLSSLEASDCNPKPQIRNDDNILADNTCSTAEEDISDLQVGGRESTMNKNINKPDEEKEDTAKAVTAKEP